MLCLYNTPVVHNSEIRFDFVTLSCFGFYHLKHIHGPDSIYDGGGTRERDGGGTRELLPVKASNISHFESQMDHFFIHCYTSQQIRYRRTRAHTHAFFSNSHAVYGLG